jgi:hypothetical protein
MDAPFPFGFPAPTALYLTLLVATWMLHVVFMHYVLGGSIYLALRTLRRGERHDAGATVSLLREWMPFILSAAITAGIAPLLFAQVVYQQRFYTANLLLFYRWLAILPALLIAFYLLYVLKAHVAFVQQAAVRLVVKLIVCACVLYVAWLWTMNHLLSVQSLETWTAQYAEGTVYYRTSELLPRLALWVASAFPTLAVWLAWQLWWNTDGGPELLTDIERETSRADIRHVALVGMIGLGLLTALALVYGSMLPGDVRSVITGRLSGLYLIFAAVGIAAQFAGWVLIRRRAQLSRSLLILQTAGVVATLAGLAVVREAIRLARVNIADLFPAHAAAAEVSGFWLFACVLVINMALIVWCARIIRHAQS